MADKENRKSMFLELNQALQKKRSKSETDVSTVGEMNTSTSNVHSTSLLSPQSLSKERSQHSAPDLCLPTIRPRSPLMPKKPLKPRSRSANDGSTEGSMSSLLLPQTKPKGPASNRYSAPNLPAEGVQAGPEICTKKPLLPKLSPDSRARQAEDGPNESMVDSEKQGTFLQRSEEYASNGGDSPCAHGMKKIDCSHCSGGVHWEKDESVKVDMLKIVWFHPTLTRHQAEAELTVCEEGVYLLRPRIEGSRMKGYSLDVRSSHSVKHFKVSVENGDLVFGEEHFSDLDSFLEYFDSHPSINTDHVVTCQHPYPREIDEIHDYYFLTNHFVPTKSKRKKIAKSLETRTFSLCSKEGYLLKVGQKVKSWKRRWFVLKDNLLRYYVSEKHTQPIKDIELKDISEVSSCDFPGKLNTFQLVTSYRTFYIQAPSANIMEDWLQILEFKLDELKEAERIKKESLNTSTPSVRVS